MIQFIDEHRDRFTVEFICQTLKSNREGGFITSRGYRQSKARGLSARSLRDAALVEHISAVHSANYGVYGVRKIWHVLRRDGIDIGREQTARLMRLAGVTGKGKGRSPVTTRKPKGPDPRPDLVARDFTAPAPGALWVADITYVRTRKGVRIHRFCHRCVLPADRRMGAIGFDAYRGVAAASAQPDDRQRKGNLKPDPPL